MLLHQAAGLRSRSRTCSRANATERFFTRRLHRLSEWMADIDGAVLDMFADDEYRRIGQIDWLVTGEVVSEKAHQGKNQNRK